MQKELTALLTEGTSTKFFKELEKYDSITTSDCLIKNNDIIDIRITRENGRLGKWTLTENITQLSPKRKKEGSSLKTLYKLFEGKEVRYDSSVALLAHKYTSYKKRDTDNVESDWFLIDTDCPYEETDNGVPYLRTIKLVLPKKQYRIMMETRLAVYDIDKKIIYPFLSMSSASVGKSLDAATLFKKSDSGVAGSIGAAMLLADRISRRSISLVIRDDAELFKPVLSIAGKRFTPPYPVSFYKAVCDYLSGHGLYCLDHWYCDCDCIAAEFTQAGTTNMTQVTLGLIPGIITTVKFYKIVNGAKILLQTNKLSRVIDGKADFSSNSTLEKIFEGITTVFNSFEKYWRSPMLDEICDTRLWLESFPKLLGKKNLMKVKKSMPIYMKKRDFYYQTLDATKDFQLAAYYNNIKENFYWDLLLQLTKEEEI